MSGVIRAAFQRSKYSVCTLQRNHGSSVFLQQLPKCFSTESKQPPQNSTAPPLSTESEQPPQNSTASFPFLRTDNSGLTYGRLLGIHKHTLKTDIINFLEGCNLTLEDVKVEYNRAYMPLSMMLQFPNYQAFDNAIRTITRKGRLYRLEKADRGKWDIVTPYDGKTILIEGLPRNSAIFEDFERIFSGFGYDQSSINMFLRSGGGVDPIKMATVRFHSRTQAMNAFISKNKTFCVNNRILLRVLQ